MTAAREALPRGDSDRLRIALGQCSQSGRKETNQDFHGACMPNEPLLTSKGCVIVLADGISTSDVSRAAAESAVGGFLEDYYSTPEAWSVKTSAQRVLTAVNSWLHAQTRRSPYRYDRDRGYVCTLSALVVKAATAHVFHVGDCRVYHLRGGVLEQLTSDHRLRITREESCLTAALGADEHVEIEYRTLPVEAGDVFVLATDGVHEHVGAGVMARTLSERRADPGAAARALVEAAYANGSGDNLTVQVARIECVPRPEPAELCARLAALPCPPTLEPRRLFDGYKIVREIHASNRSHMYLAVDADTDALVALKTPSTEVASDPGRLERFVAEEWIARRVDSPHVARAFLPVRRRSALYTVTEFVEGRTLTQWMRDNPRPDVGTVRGIVEQIAQGLRAFHRLEMIHRDLRPDNVMIDGTGTVKLIDFGSVRVAGIDEALPAREESVALGTAPYSAPEYFLGEAGSSRSDIFSLGVIAYQMLTGRLPYGTRVAKTRSRLDQMRLRYTSVLDFNAEAPAWIDGPLRKALQPDPDRRYAALSELVYDLRHPRRAPAARPRLPIIERNPVAFWQGVASILAIVAAALAVALVR